jgi:hypothetical protein
MNIRVRNNCFWQQRTGYFRKHSLHYIHCIYVQIRTSSFLVQLTALSVQRDAHPLYWKGDWLEEAGFNSWQGQQNFQTCSPDLLWGPPARLFNASRGNFSADKAAGA